MALSGIQIMTSPMKALAGKEGAGRLPGGGGYGDPVKGRALPSGTPTASEGPKAIGAGPSPGGGRGRSRV